MQPKTKFTKQDGNTGVVRPGGTGILVIIAPSEKGSTAPGSYTAPAAASNDYGAGPLAEDASYVLDEAGNPVVLIKAAASTAAAYGAVDVTGVTGTSVVTAGASAPLDDFQKVIVKVLVGGTIGVAGITYTYSLDGGINTSPPQALGTANTLTIPGTGVSFALAAGTLIANDTWNCAITGPRMNNADLTTALESLRTSKLPYEGILVHADITQQMVATLDTWLAARENEGKFRFFLANGRYKTSAETEAQFLTAMTTAFSGTTSIRGCVGADGGDLPSPLTGITQTRPTALGLAARAMASSIATDAAYVADGPIPGFALTDAKMNPKHHDESDSPGLDDQRLVTFRTWNNRAGAYINNPNVISPPGSDYVYLQHIRVMNRACELAYELLTNHLSQGVRKQVGTPQNPDLVRIADEDADLIETSINAILKQALKGLVTDVRFTLKRDDDLSSNAGAVVHASVDVEALAYIKEFDVTASFQKNIAAKAA